MLTMLKFVYTYLCWIENKLDESIDLLRAFKWQCLFDSIDAGLSVEL